MVLKCKTIQSISRKAYIEGSRQLRMHFQQCDLNDIEILCVRKKKCGNRDVITYELTEAMFDSVLKAESRYLNKHQHKVREYLIEVCSGKHDTLHDRKATYKEVWNIIYSSKSKVFAQGNTSEVVGWVVAISNFDKDSGRPPLNSIVVRGDTGEPGVAWEEWQQYSGTKFKTFKSAQKKCWGWEEDNSWD